MDRPPARLRANHASTVPSRFVYLDTEAHSTQVPHGQRQSFRLAVLRFDRWRSEASRWSPPRYETVRATRTLWERVEAFTRDRARTVVVAHNLGYDLLVSEALVHLPALGWEMKQCRLESTKSWGIWTKGRRTLAFIDTLSWLPRALAKLGEMVGVPKPPLPAWEDSDEAWQERCQADVTIMAEAYRRVLEWLRANDCGQWRPTGAGQSWSAFRHKFPPTQVVHHGQADLYELEREAAHTGRCEAWYWGQLGPGPWTEWDMELAYPRIAAEAQLPIVPRGSYREPSLASWHALRRRYSLLTTAEVTTTRPVVPTHRDGRILWPTGTFTTTLWENELVLALDHGATFRPLHVQAYRRAPVLAPWADWIMGLCDERTGEPDPVVRLMLKFWARSVIGRFGMQWTKWERWGDHPAWGVLSGLGRFGEGDHARRYLHLGHQFLVEGDEEEAPDSAPAIMSWIMAECRVRLWRQMIAVGLEHIAYVDTDSMIVSPTGDRRMRHLHPEGWRPKHAWHSVEVLGPRQLVLAGEIKAAGIPSRARKIGAHGWSGESWSSPMTMLARSDPSAVLVMRRQGELQGVDERRRHAPGGSTRPVYIADPLSASA